jgi:hypothetical protein
MGFIATRLKINFFRRMTMRAGSDCQMTSQQYAFVLLMLTGLFGFRVVAQLVQAWHPVDFLPPYSVWHSGALPYGLLVGVQGVILAACLRIVWGVFKGTLAPSRQKGKILFPLGTIYLLAMCTRLLVGLTIAPDHYWFGATLPTVFHLVLASFLILYGRFHYITSQSSSSSHRNKPE